MVGSLVHSGRGAPADSCDHGVVGDRDDRECAVAVAVPDRLGPYHVLRPLGSGGMGDVVLAADDRPETDPAEVAVKVLQARSGRRARLPAALPA